MKNNLLFRPTTLHAAINDIKDFMEAQYYKLGELSDEVHEINQKAMEDKKKLLADFLHDESVGGWPEKNWKDYLLDWHDSLDHYFSTTHGKLPEFNTFKLMHAFAKERRPEIINDYPADLQAILKTKGYIDHTKKSNLISYTEFPDTLMLYILPDTTEEECIAQLKHISWVSDMVGASYESELKEGERDLWNEMDLGGDDDVDYYGGYLDSQVEFYRAYLFTITNNPKFLETWEI